jgi:molybdopterin converting factor small subunit
MIRVRVTFFALARDLAGAGNADVELPAGATNATLLAALVGRYPALATDEVAVIPPVSGG